jgi:hypothetical protein
MKIMIGLLAAAILGTGGFAFAAGVDDSQPARTVSLPGAPTTDDTTTATTTAETTTAATTTTENEVEDISGPCDEPEHANDPRCNGGVAADDDNSGRGRGRHDDNGNDDDNDHEDRSGSNSGRG